MPRVLLAIVAIVAISSSGPMATDLRQARGLIPPEYIATLERALGAYTAGDDRAVETLFRTREGIVSMSALGAVFGRPAEWSRPRAAFLAEVAVAAPLSNPGKLTSIQLGLSLAVSRPTVPGAAPDDDRFEILVHQVMLGVLQGAKMYPQQLDYLDAIAPRYDAAAQQGATLETRFALARGIAAGGACCPPKGDQLRTELFSRPLDRRTLDGFDEAIRAFDRASADPKLAVEARIRAGALQYAMDRPADAIAWLDRVDVEPTDRVLNYAQALVRARALDLLNRPEASAAAYEAARGVFPAAQTPAIGRAAALLRSGQTTDAVRVAAAARTLPPDSPDPWVDFVKADGRFVNVWLAELRAHRQ